MNGCIHNKEIKLPEMKLDYHFRCSAMGTYLKESDIKQSCRFYTPPYKVIQLSIEDFIDN